MSNIDMSLEDIIKSTKQKGRGRGGPRRGASNNGTYGGSRSGGPIRGNSNLGVRQTPYSIAKPSRRSTDGAWQHDLFEDAGNPRGRPVGIETGTKLYVSNLDYGVSNEDVKELFSEVGDLKRCSLHYDRSGRSKGTAEVVFSRKNDALAAVKRYNNVQLDGKPMKIELIGTNLVTGSTRVGNGISVSGRGGRTGVMGNRPARGRGGFGRGRGGFGRGRERGRGRRDTPIQTKTVEELDAELETYHTAAMQTS